MFYLSLFFDVSFNFIAPFYDRLVKLVYGNKLNIAQEHFLSSLKKDSTILIIGGGTGEIIKSIDEKVSGCHLIYLDASEKMIQLAHRNKPRFNVVEFYQSSVFDYSSSQKVDIVITPYFFDLFSKSEILKIMKTIKPHLNPMAQWLNVDFVKAGFWQKIQLGSMYLFFKLVAGVKNTSLVEMDEIFADFDFILVKQKCFFKPRITASLYMLK